MPDLSRLVGFCVRRRWWVVIFAALCAIGSVAAIETRLGVTTDTDGLFAATLPWKQHGAELQHAFPQNEDLLVAVVDADIPEEAEATARDLAHALSADHLHFTAVTQPDASPYLERNAFLFLDRGKLTDILDRTIDAQPFLGKLAADPSLRGLCDALALVGEGIRTGQANLGPLLPALRGFHAGLAAAAGGKPQPLSWERLLAGPVADQAGRFHFVLAKPKLDYDALEPGKEAGSAIRDAAAQLPFVHDGSAHVRLTGSVALGDEEFATVAQGAVSGLIGSLLLVILWLFLALRSWRVIVPVVLTLLLGLTLTGGFAALAVGTLNLVSVAFAILFVGIAVDFAIQFSVRFREAQLGAPDLQTALVQTGRHAGLQILVAAVATAAGFLAFTPTDFLGVAQLGLIAGIGMLIAFVCTLTFLPAATTFFKPAGGVREAGLAALRPLDRWIARTRWPVLAVFGALACISLLLLPMLHFDSDPLHTKRADTEAMRTLADLMNDPVTSPYSMELLAANVADADRLADRLGKLPDVDSVLWLHSFVPDDQDTKLPLLADASSLLAPTLAEQPAKPVSVAALRGAVHGLAEKLAPIVSGLPQDHPLAAIAHDLDRLQTAPDATLLAANVALTRFLPEQLARLRVALNATPVTDRDVPDAMRRDWVAPDGRLRLQIVPVAGLRGSAALHDFVAHVQAIAPNAAGSAVTIVRSADTIVHAFKVAATSALAAITILLALALRRVTDVLLVLAPLLLSSLLTVGVAVAVHLPLNFANIIALPLLLGVGVSFNIYFVMNWRAGMAAPLTSATARAVLFSALTTATAFGSLALSYHPGTSSMGTLLLLSLCCTVICTMLFLPALLAVATRARPAPIGAALDADGVIQHGR